ncbi:MAG: tyrosine-type recombinase/integrase, partial [Alphaproteobacteria bacterium]|nr:tyrosine-type recombinase/integrase [Alphaproteobacteria bacterium]
LPRKGAFVFPGRLPGKPFSGLPKAWPRIIARAEADLLTALTPHGLRHGFASVGADLGLTEITIAALLGHSAASVTGRYIHHVDTALVAAANRVAARIAAAMDGREEGAEVVPLWGRA